LTASRNGLQKPDDALDAVVVECELDASPDRVWRALTVPEIVAEWLFPTTISPAVGERFTFDAPPAEGGPIHCEVVEAEPGRRLSYTWCHPGRGGGAPLDSRVSFEISEAEGGRTHLRIVHSGLPLGLGGLRSVSTMLAGTFPDQRPRRRGRLAGRILAAGRIAASTARLRRAA
jgi:uncharacterized protein YndB with AHSA1/START domain